MSHVLIADDTNTDIPMSNKRLSWRIISIYAFYAFHGTFLSIAAS